jgi:nitrate reductase gamma subunit
MWESFMYFVMIPMVYLAFAVLIFGIAYKLYSVFKTPDVPGTLAIYPAKNSLALSVAIDSLLAPAAYNKDRGFWMVIMVFHAAILLLIIGHLELVRNFGVIQIVPHKIFLGAGAVGISLILTTIYFLFRRFKSPYRDISVPEDYVILLILFFCILFGSIAHLSSRYGSYAALVDIAVEDYRSYLGSLFSLNPVLPGRITHAPHYVVLVLHILFANIFMMLFPFSKMIHSVFIFFAHVLKNRQEK